MKIGKYLLISTTVLGLVNPLVVLADDQVNSNSNVVSSISKRATNKPKNNIESINKSKITANDDIVTFDDPALEKAVRENFEKGKPADEPLTKSDFSNFYKILASGGYGSNGDFDVRIDNPTSLKGLEALKYLPNETPDGAPTVISLNLHGVKSDISLESLKGLHNINRVWLYKDNYTNDDIANLNSMNWDGNVNSIVLETADWDSSNTYRKRDGLTNDQIKSLEPMIDKAYNKGLDDVVLWDNQITDFSQFGKYPNLYVEALYQYQTVTKPVSVKEGQKDVSFDSQIIGLDGNAITDSVNTANGDLSSQDGKYTISNYREGNVADTIVIQGERSQEDQMMKHIHNYSNGSKLVQSGTELYKIGDPVKAADVTVKYVDENGKNIEDPTIISGNFDDSFETKQKTFEGYTFHDVKGETSGKLDSQPKTVTYTYYKDNGSNHTVNFYDMNGKKIADEISIDGTYKDAYDLTDQVNKVLIDLKKQGYKQVSNYGLIKGNFVQLHDGADYILTKLPANEVGTVKANYVDEQGKVITDSEIKGGKLGSVYKTEKKSIKGYTFKEVKGNETGKITDKEQVVTYIYTKNPEKGADVTVKYVDDNGKEIAKSEVKSGNIGDKYTTEKKDITGYTFKEVKGSTNGQFTDKAQTVTYIYIKNDDNVKPSDPSQPAKPDTPDHSGDTDKPTDNNSNTSEHPGNNSTVNDVVNNVVEGVQTVLPKTAAEKVTLAGIVSVVLASLVGLIVWKKRK